MQGNEKTSRRDIRTLGLVLLGGFGLFGLLLWRAGRDPQLGWAWAGTGRQMAALGLWSAGLVLGLVCIILPRAGRYIHRVWMGLGRGLGMVMTTVLLTALFFLFLPFFQFIRLSDPLRRRLGADSYWEPHRSQEPTLERMARPF
jgi:hypothetical protein